MYETYCFENIKPVIHPTVKIWDYTDVVGDVTIGKNTIVGRSSFVYGKHAPVTIGENCQFIGWNFISDGTKIGNNVFIGGGTQFTNDKFPSPHQITPKLDYVIVEDDVVIGANCTILPGVTIGQGSVIGAGSVVTKNIPTGSIVYGNPARPKMDFRF